MEPLCDDAWRVALSAYLKAEMARRNITFQEMARRLSAQTGVEWERTATFNKISRGSFSATFFLQALASLGMQDELLAEIAAYAGDDAHGTK